MSRSFHVTRKNFRLCSKRELNEMAEDDFSEFTEWAKKSQVKNQEIQKRIFDKVYCDMASDPACTDEQIESMDDRESRFKALHTRYYTEVKEEG